MNKRLLLLALSAFSLFVIPGHAQEPATEGPSDILTIGAGVGIMTFFGDMGVDSELSTFTNIRPAFNVNFERRFGDYVGVSLNGLFGSVAHSKRSAIPADNLNFESDITQFGIDVALHFDNDKIIKRQSMFSPYISAGVAYTLFDPHGDLTDANGNTYYYWTDGSIMDRPEEADTFGNASALQRDYTYESQLTDSANNYSRNALAFPLTVGLKWKFSERVQGRVFGSYVLTQSDFIDNYSIDDKNDKYLNAGFSLHITLRKADPAAKAQQKIYESVDFASLSDGDADKDGVKDFDDECPDTPKGLKVSNKGCPMDDDKDGVPNYLDREANSVKGAIVDQYGITVDDNYLARQTAARDSVSTVRTQAFASSPNLQTLSQFDRDLAAGGGTTTGNANVDAANTLPAEYKEADLNGDGLIQSTEITATIDRFFEGTSSFTVARIQDLIDYFFEQ